jgi:hypothetical protein
MGKFPLHCRSVQRGGQFQAELLEQDLPMLGGLAEARLRIAISDLAGSTTSTIAISDRASKTCRGSSPSPAGRQHAATVFQST